VVDFIKVKEGISIPSAHCKVRIVDLDF